MSPVGNTTVDSSDNTSSHQFDTFKYTCATSTITLFNNLEALLLEKSFSDNNNTEAGKDINQQHNKSSNVDLHNHEEENNPIIGTLLNDETKSPINIDPHMMTENINQITIYTSNTKEPSTSTDITPTKTCTEIVKPNFDNTGTTQAIQQPINHHPYHDAPINLNAHKELHDTSLTKSKCPDQGPGITNKENIENDKPKQAYDNADSSAYSLPTPVILDNLPKKASPSPPTDFSPPLTPSKDTNSMDPNNLKPDGKLCTQKDEDRPIGTWNPQSNAPKPTSIINVTESESVNSGNKYTAKTPIEPNFATNTLADCVSEPLRQIYPKTKPNDTFEPKKQIDELIRKPTPSLSTRLLDVSASSDTSNSWISDFPSPIDQSYRSSLIPSPYTSSSPHSSPILPQHPQEKENRLSIISTNSLESQTNLSPVPFVYHKLDGTSTIFKTMSQPNVSVEFAISPSLYGSDLLDTPIAKTFNTFLNDEWENSPISIPIHSQEIKSTEDNHSPHNNQLNSQVHPVYSSINPRTQASIDQHQIHISSSQNTLDSVPSIPSQEIESISSSPQYHTPPATNSINTRNKIKNRETSPLDQNNNSQPSIENNIDRTNIDRNASKFQPSTLKTINTYSTDEEFDNIVTDKQPFNQTTKFCLDDKKQDVKPEISPMIEPEYSSNEISPIVWIGDTPNQEEWVNRFGTQRPKTPNRSRISKRKRPFRKKMQSLHVTTNGNLDNNSPQTQTSHQALFEEGEGEYKTPTGTKPQLFERSHVTKSRCKSQRNYQRKKSNLFFDISQLDDISKDNNNTKINLFDDNVISKKNSVDNLLSSPMDFQFTPPSPLFTPTNTIYGIKEDNPTMKTITSYRVSNDEFFEHKPDLNSKEEASFEVSLSIKHQEKKVRNEEISDHFDQGIENSSGCLNKDNIEINNSTSKSIMDENSNNIAKHTPKIHNQQSNLELDEIDQLNKETINTLGKESFGNRNFSEGEFEPLKLEDKIEAKTISKLSTDSFENLLASDSVELDLSPHIIPTLFNDEGFEISPSLLSPLPLSPLPSSPVNLLNSPLTSQIKMCSENRFNKQTTSQEQPTSNISKLGADKTDTTIITSKLDDVNRSSPHDLNKLNKNLDAKDNDDTHIDDTIPSKVNIVVKCSKKHLISPTHDMQSKTKRPTHLTPTKASKDLSSDKINQTKLDSKKRRITRELAKKDFSDFPSPYLRLAGESLSERIAKKKNNENSSANQQNKIDELSFLSGSDTDTESTSTQNKISEYAITPKRVNTPKTSQKNVTSKTPQTDITPKRLQRGASPKSLHSDTTHKTPQKDITPKTPQKDIIPITPPKDITQKIQNDLTHKTPKKAVTPTREKEVYRPKRSPSPRANNTPYRLTTHAKKNTPSNSPINQLKKLASPRIK